MKRAKGRVTVLTDNTVPARSETLAEHGFAALVETERGSFLFDTGRGRTVVHNAVVLKRDLAAIDKVILSHAHGDHTGGLPEVLLACTGRPLPVLAHPDVFAERYRTKRGERIHGGIPYQRGYLEKMGAHFVFNRSFVEIEEGVFLTGEVPRETDFEGGDMADRVIVREAGTEPDLILDDQSLVVRTEEGLLLLLGCAHAGVVNVMRHAIRMTGLDHFSAIVGGTHIGLSGEAQHEATIEALKQFDIDRIVPAHCTGLETMCRLRGALGEACRFSHVGRTVSF